MNGESAPDDEHMNDSPMGFIGLGSMGAPMAANLAGAGWSLIVHDAAGTRARAPADTTLAQSVAEVASQAATIFLSLPDSTVVDAVAETIVATPSAVTKRVVDTSTIGIAQAHRIHGKLAAAAIEYVDAPVSGGVAGARAGTVSIMVSSPTMLIVAALLLGVM